MYYLEHELITRVKQLDDFKYIPKGYWIIGVRSSEETPDHFDDVFYLMKGHSMITHVSGTTNPGLSILTGGFEKYNEHGSAILESNRIYYDVWEPGYHRGKVKALKQLGNSVTVYRDGDKDFLSEEIGRKEEGYFGINFHPDQYDLDAEDNERETIGGWSAGCQVVNDISLYKEIIDLVWSQKKITYCLLKEFSI